MPPSDVKVLFSTDGTRLFAEATGDRSNPHLVLIAGLTLSGCVFDEICADKRLLDSLYIVRQQILPTAQLIDIPQVRYDTRGHGRSGKPSTREAYESKLFADDFKTVMDAYGLKKPVLAGW
jgi:pimeloyl-ACP methyl ester carboxylesterase